MRASPRCAPAVACAHTTAKRITKRALRSNGGDIILLHDGSNEMPAADRHRSLETVEATLGDFTPKGFKFVTVPQLVEAGRP